MNHFKNIDVKGNVSKLLSKRVSLETISLIIGLCIIIFIIVFWTRKMKRNLWKTNNRNLDRLYPNIPPISSINTSNERFGYKLRDYYVKTAYNCCASGSFKHDWVSLKALKTCIQQGARCLDFQVFSVDDLPVIAVTDNNDYNSKGSYNSIAFSKAMSVISTHAFSASSCPCHNDPLILHFRISSKNTSVMDKMAKDISTSLKMRLLGSENSYENQGNNIGSKNLKDLKGKVIIVVDKSYANPTKTQLDEYVNLTSNSVFMRSLRYHDVKFTPDMDELINFNKKYMTMCIPDIGQHPQNPSASVAHKYGCQYVAMSFQKMDDKMKYYNTLFNEEGSSFILKPEVLRYTPVEIKVPEPPPKELSYKERKVETDFYSFKI